MPSGATDTIIIGFCMSEKETAHGDVERERERQERGRGRIKRQTLRVNVDDREKEM